MRPLFFLFTLLLACGKKEEPVGNKPPYDAQVTAQLERVAGNTFTYRFVASAKDTDGDPLQFSWDFGNGTTNASGQATETAQFADGRDYTVTVRITDGKSPALVATVPVSTQTGTITVDLNRTYQTIEGFGAFGGQDLWYSSGPYTTAPFVNDVVNDLGLTISREEVVGSLEPVNDNDDPNVTDLSKFNLTVRPSNKDHLPFGVRVPHLRALKEAGVRKFIASVWSPPNWMKYNNQLGNGTDNQTSAPDYTTSPTATTNQLKPEYYEEFAEFCYAYCRIFEREVGLPLYAISLQNEPRFSQFYQSCVYNGPALRETLRAVGRRFKKEGIPTRIFLPEDLQWTDRMRDMLMPSLLDAETRDYVSIVATHGYGFDGVQPNSPDAATWRTIASWGAPYGKPLWMTETSGFPNDFGGAMKLSGAIHNALRYGNAEAWVFWTVAEPNLSAYSLMDKNLNKSKRYYVSKNYYRYIRPGAVRVEASASTDDILPVVVTEKGKQVLVLTNMGATDRVMKLTGTGLKTAFSAYRTSETEDCKTLGAITGPTVVLPRQSVTTLVTE